MRECRASKKYCRKCDKRRNTDVECCKGEKAENEPGMSGKTKNMKIVEKLKKHLN